MSVAYAEIKAQEDDNDGITDRRTVAYAHGRLPIYMTACTSSKQGNRGVARST